MDALKIMRRLANVFVRGVYQSRASDGTLTAQQLSGEVHSALLSPKAYGFASKGVGGKTYTIFNGGNRDDGVVILHELDGAPTLADNEVAVWNNQGAVITLKADGTVELQGDAFGGLIKINDLTTKLNALVSSFNTHSHSGAGANDTVAAQFVAANYENGTVNHG